MRKVFSRHGGVGMKAIKINGLPNRCRATLLSAAITGLLVSAPTYAQDDSELEEIVVVGIRGSLERSLDIKRESTGFVDAISSEDVGKLPDNNVAEALQRVPGVAIQRNRGEGDFVSIRGLGPDFVRGTVNGRTLLSATEFVDPNINGGINTSTGRAANFDTLPSEIINTLEVIKSPSAKHVEGGIGGVVNLKTARPLSLGNKYSVSVDGTYRDFSEETDPTFSGLANWTNDDNTFGFLLSAQYSERSIREDFSRTFGYFPSATVGTTGPFDIDNDGTGDGVTSIPFPLSNNAESYEESRERTTLAAAAQWLTSDDSEWTLDVIYSERDVASTSSNLIYLPIPFPSDLAGQTVNPDGSIQVGDLVTGGAFTTIPSTLRPELTTDLQEYTDEVLSVGLNFAKQVGNWVLSVDLNYSQAEGDNNFDRVRHDGDNGTFVFSTDISPAGFSITQTNAGGGPATDLSNPANFVVSVFDDRVATNEDDEIALQFDATRDIGGFVSSIDTGVRVRQRTKNATRAANGNGIGVVAAGITADQAGFVRGNDNFLDGSYSATFGYENLPFPDNASQRAALADYMAANGLSTSIAPDPFGTFEVEETTYAGYAQMNFDGQVGGVPYVGDFGARLVLTQQDISAFDAEARIQDNGGMDGTIFDSLTVGSPTAFNSSETYANVLPALNFRFELDNNLFLRVAASKSLTRPTFTSLAPGLSINANCSCDNNNDNFSVAATAGNPGLAPYESTNFDLGIEWYFGDSSAAYAGLFHKELDDYIAVVTNNNVSTLGSAPIRAIGIEQDGTSNSIALDQVSQPDNQGTAQVSGVELGYLHTFDSGFGYNLNVTLTENSAEFQDSGSPIDFPGVSDTSYNITGFYENNALQARLSYSYRSDYLLVPDGVGGLGSQIFADEFAQLDASISYAIGDNYTVVLSALNLTDEEQELFERIPGAGDRFESLSHVGTRFALGVRATF